MPAGSAYSCLGADAAPLRSGTTSVTTIADPLLQPEIVLTLVKIVFASASTKAVLDRQPAGREPSQLQRWLTWSSRAMTFSLPASIFVAKCCTDHPV